ncbi:MULTISPECIES: alkaline phosphatase family protein [unclassified Salipiger]|uniref:alkaline phosphatase family protein n=1 Tax=unclassified Salipiger TaxID=2640570 RepID=UPI0013B63CA2|nr:MULTISPECIES: nucleotide pyrophosphatase/phosphodiesterase family protein [unclassified Salipiger]NDV48605.1 alkaline phosphatase family protein [Salipiger sp. PrR003]NDW30693.1 alkaline phosphatase family protein [Salipiger sp. PrR007]
MTPTLVILVVGLTPKLVGQFTPNIAALAARGALRPLETVIPAVTCTVQATLATGLPPSGHGAVANGWYFRDLKEVLLWRQPNSLLQGEKIWDAGKARDPGFTCAKMFWWYNMYSTADYSATPRPMYPADGRKIPDHYAHPPELHDELDAKLGRFPLFTFWGPTASIRSSAWIADATLHVMETRRPTLTLTYLPHLDYDLQKFGPDLDHPEVQQSLRDIDALVGKLIAAADTEGRRVLVVSEYGITPVRDAIHINRALREAGLIAVRPEEHGREILDAGASAAFAMSDHQLAHVYVNDRARLAEVKALIEGLDGVEAVWDEEGKRANGLDHPRSGELVAISRPDRWFSYYYWLDEAKAPDFAPTVDIHRKPGYDPVELFLDPALRFPKLAAGWKLGKRKMGFRQMLDLISPSRTDLVKGSHGRITEDPGDGPLVISSEPGMLPEGPVRAVDFKALTLSHVFD